MKRLFLAGALAAAAVCLSPGAASAQTGTARGKVVDEKGQALEGAQVVLEYQGPMTRKFETKTNKKGEFTQVGMQPGVYRVTANKEGYTGTFVEARINLGDPVYLPDLKLVPKSAAGAAPGADKSNDELRAGFEKGNALMNEGKLDEAEAEFRALIAKNPSVPQLHHNLAVVLSKKKDAAGAEAAYLKALEVRPDYVDGYAALSNFYLSNNQGDKATEVINKALAAQPDNAKLHFQLGLAQFSSGQYEPAAATFTKVATMDPSNAEVHYYLGTIALTSGKKAECVEHLEKYLAAKPTNAQNAGVAPGLLQACKAK
jgi:tetratricopeptide (TPR) repeat protein